MMVWAGLGPGWCEGWCGLGLGSGLCRLVWARAEVGVVWVGAGLELVCATRAGLGLVCARAGLGLAWARLGHGLLRLVCDGGSGSCESQLILGWGGLLGRRHE